MASDEGGTRNANRAVGLAFAVLWAIGGAAALIASRHVSFTGSTGPKLLGQFPVNGLHGLVMLVIAGALLAGALGPPGAARRVNLVVGVLWLAMDLYALLTGQSTHNVLAIDGHDADLLLLAALALLAVGLVLDLPATHGSGRKYRTVRYGQGPRYVDESELRSAGSRR